MLVKAGTGQPISALQLDAALLLSDLSGSFSLDEEQHNYVLGENRTLLVMQVPEIRIAVRMSLPLAQHVGTPEMMETVSTFLPQEGLWAAFSTNSSTADTLGFRPTILSPIRR